jgi:Family of unknown function (DUF6084)
MAAIPPVVQQHIPALAFDVRGVTAVQPAAVPTLEFAVAIDSGGTAIRSILLDVQIQIAARQRDYGDDADAGLEELFGTRDRWGTTLRTLPWTRTTVVVAPFTEATTTHVGVPCTYDLEVTASRYFAALHDGEVPLEFLFSGSVFFAGSGGLLQTTRIGWDQDADYRMPVAVWREMMDRHFSGAAWLRLGRPAHERLAAYRAQHGLPSWDATIEALIPDD